MYLHAGHLVIAYMYLHSLNFTGLDGERAVIFQGFPTVFGMEFWLFNFLKISIELEDIKDKFQDK